MKAILISIKPKYVADILNGKKTIEIRKTAPNCDLPIDVYIYCTKGKPRAIMTDKGCVVANTLEVGGNSQYKSGYSCSGGVVAKFTLNKVEEIEIVYSQENEFGGYSESYRTKTLSTNELLNKSQLDYFELSEYLKDYTPFGYAWHISNLVIFDEPKELSEFTVSKTFMPKTKPLTFKHKLTKSPQSWGYVEEE